MPGTGSSSRQCRAHEGEVKDIWPAPRSWTLQGALALGEEMGYAIVPALQAARRCRRLQPVICGDFPARR